MQMEKQQFYKMVPYDASASVPMVIYDARPGRQNPKGGPTVRTATQLIDIFPTILTLAKVETSLWPTLDGYSLTPLMAVEGDTSTIEDDTAAVAVPAAGPHPDFIVSQFHGDNIAMSWFLVVKDSVVLPDSHHTTSEASATTGTLKLILWGTG
jgi:arylsulfatase A-like enzyme